MPQGMQIADSNGVYPTLRGCGGGGYQQGNLLIRKEVPVVVSGTNRLINGKQPSGELLRTGCIQRYVGDGEDT